MSYSVMFALLLLTPLLFSLLCFACRKWGHSATRTVTVLHSLGITLLLILTLWVVQTAADAGEIFAAGLWLHIDGLGGLFLAILGVIGFLTGVYSIGYMRHEVAHGELSPVTLCDYYGFFHLFLFTMLLVVTSNNLIVMWAAIEATTLSSAFLVGIYGQRSSLEAAWKYIIICTVGVAFGLFGTVLVYANAASVMPQAEMAIFWSEVLKQSSLLDPTLMLLAFVFVLIGFGTKTGLFPMHAWLPDAHSEAPSPVSALLSAVLLNCALLVLIRYYIIICQAIGSDFPNRLLLIFGMLSVAVAAFFILVQRDIKRLLAYSSVENHGTGRGGARHWRAAGNFCRAAAHLKPQSGKNAAVLRFRQCTAQVRHARSQRRLRNAQNHAIYRRAVWRRCAGAGRDAALQHFS